MIGSSHVRKTSSRVAALLTVLVLALGVPAFALAQAPAGEGQPVGAAAGAGEPAGGGGGLAATGFDAWKVGAAGVVCLAAGVVLLRTTRRVRSEA